MSPHPAVILYSYIANGSRYYRILDLVTNSLAGCRAEPTCYAAYYSFLSDTPQWVIDQYPEYFL